MKYIVSLSAIALSVIFAKAEGIEFFHGTFEEALALAKKEDKVIFVDAYAVWCGPCKRMAKDVFPDAEVGKFYNKNFVSLKLDMERGEGLEFRKKYPVAAFPTLFYIAANGEVVQKVKGAQNVDNFIKIGQKALQLTDRSGEFAEKYEKGDRSPELMYNYVRSLNRAGKPSLKIANEYLRSQKDLSSEFNLRFLFEATIDADSKIFDHFIEQRNAIEQLYSKEEIEEKIIGACETNVQKAIDFEFEDLMDGAIDKMNEYCQSYAQEFEIRSKMKYSLAMKDVKGYLDATKDFAKKVIKKDKQALDNLATDMVTSFKGNKEVSEKAEGYAAKAADKSEEYRYYITYAHILNLNGKKDKALKVAAQAKGLAGKKSPRDVKMVEAIIRKIEQG